MTSIARTMREQRLRYAVARETDRQAVVLGQEIADALVSHAMGNIDARFPDEEARMHQAERAEKTLQPVIAMLLEANLAEGSAAACADFLTQLDAQEFPWAGLADP